MADAKVRSKRHKLQSLPNSRSEAKSLRAPRYLTGLPCKHGHIAERRTGDGGCVVCSRVYAARYGEALRCDQVLRDQALTKKRNQKRKRYQSDKAHRQRVLERQRRYLANPEVACRIHHANKLRRELLAADPNYRIAENIRNRDYKRKRRADPKVRRMLQDGENARRRERRKTDPEYREREKANTRECARRRFDTDLVWRDKDRKRKREFMKRKWRADPDFRQKFYAWRDAKLRSDPNFKLAKILRDRLYVALRGRSKHGSGVKLLGCSVEAARFHLEAQFKPGMSWKNHSYRGWHVDHKRPLSSFDLTDPSQLAMACHYTNLQPMWAKPNLRKGARLMMEVA